MPYPNKTESNKRNEIKRGKDEDQRYKNGTYLLVRLVSALHALALRLRVGVGSNRVEVGGGSGSGALVGRILFLRGWDAWARRGMKIGGA
jgi:hypothetical protein